MAMRPRMAACLMRACTHQTGILARAVRGDALLTALTHVTRIAMAIVVIVGKSGVVN